MTQDQSDATPPLPTFDALPLSAELRRAIEELGYTHPTPVQREVYEPASRGHDLVVQARTGTGKTAAFGMPVVDALVQRSLSRVQVIILCPTRELALQVHREIDTLGKYRQVRSVAVYGGAPMGRQIEELAAGAQVLVGTPGRVLDHLSRGTLDPRAVRTFVLDESDEMLSMGFLPQINEIHGYLPEVHQTLLFSATLPPDIQRHAETRLKSPVFLTLSGDQIGALDIEHLVYLTTGDKLKDFERILEVENPESAIVFCNTRDETKRVAAALEKLGFAADWLNADLAQNEREQVMAATRESRLRFLVCTDVAARGIDISHLTHVINYDFPESAESYVHRTGRTGRAGRTGTAISLIEPTDVGNLYLLRLTYKIFPIERQLPSAGEMKTRAELDLVEVFVNAFAKRKIHADDLSLARRLLSHDEAAYVVAGLLRDHLGARPEASAEASEARRAQNPPPQRKAHHKTTVRDGSRSPSDRQSRGPAVAPPTEPRGSVPPMVEPKSDAAPKDRAADRRSSLERPSKPRDESSPRNDSRRKEPGRRPPRDDEFEFGYSVGESVIVPVSGVSSEPFPQGAEVAPRGTEVAPQGTEVAPQGAEVASELPPVCDSSTRPPYRELFVSVGRRDGAGAGDFAGVLERAGLLQPDILAINVRGNHAFVRVSPGCFEQALSALNGAEIAGRKATAEASRSSRP